MRRIHGGLLAAALLFLAGCGSGQAVDDAAHDAEPAIRTPELAATTRAISASKPPAVTSTVLVTSPDGISSPGLDAAVSVLMERPEVTVVVVAPSDPDVSASEGRATDDDGAEPRLRDGQTMSGYPAHVLDAPVDDAVRAAVGELGLAPDLVVVGFVEGAVLGSGVETSVVAGAMRAAAAHGLPALAVTAGTEHGTDLAAAGVMLRSMFDVDLATLLTPGGRVLTVPSCGSGLVRGLVETEAAIDASAASTVDCVSVSPGGPIDDVDAHSQGFATVVELAS